MIIQSTPHTLEPVDLLTIEAYQVRQGNVNRMTYFKHTKKKVALRLSHASFSPDQAHFVVHCCTFHGYVTLCSYQYIQNVTIIVLCQYFGAQGA